MARLDIDEELVRKLASLLEETGLSEIEYEADQRRIRVARGMTTLVEAPASHPRSEAPPNAAPSQSSQSGTAREEAVATNAVVSPMVGTVYLSREPGAAPFVQVGEAVTEGQTLLIIEAMKVMNPLLSPRNGRVTAVLVNDGEPVEFGEPLIVIE